MPSAIINVMSSAAIKAGKGMMRDFGEIGQLQVSQKGSHSFATNTDVRTEKLLHRELSKARPGYGFLMEEGGEIPGEDGKFRWIIDPLDGTSNFIHAVPYFCVSIALEETITTSHKEIVAGVIFDPINNELFVAEKGAGAMLNDRRLSVSARDQFNGAMIVSGNPHFSDDKVRSLKRIEALSKTDACMRINGAIALDLAYTAAGRYDACWFEAVQPWDSAAGMLLVTEAGGILQCLDGGELSHLSGNIAATNKNLHQKVTKLLAV